MSIWPNNKRIAVMLTFNFDAEALWLARNPQNNTNFSAMSRGAYGPRQGIPRILAMLDSHKVKGTFFTPGWVAEKYESIVKEISDSGHEIAYHGYLHEEVMGISRDEEEKNMIKSESIIERITGKKIVGHRAPGGAMHPFTVEMIGKRGYLYSSSLRDCDNAYLHQAKDVAQKAVVELPIDSIFDDATYYFFSLNSPVRRGIASARYMVNIWKDEFDGLAAEGDKVISLIMHPQLSGRTSRVNAISEFVGYMKSRGAWIATSQQVASCFLAYKGVR